MKVVSIKHKALEGLWRYDETRGLPVDQVKRLRAGLTLLSAISFLRSGRHASMQHEPF